MQFDKCFYSVHPKHIGEEVRIKATADTVMIQLPSGEEIARHPRGAFKGQRMTDSDHIPPMHQEILGWSGDSFRAEAGRIGDNTHALIDRILSSRQYEVQSYKICRGVLNLKNRVEKENDKQKADAADISLTSTASAASCSYFSFLPIQLAVFHIHSILLLFCKYQLQSLVHRSLINLYLEGLPDPMSEEFLFGLYSL